MTRHRAPDPAPDPTPTPPTSIDDQAINDLRSRIDALEAWRTHNTDLLEELLGDDDPDSDPNAPIPFLLDTPTDVTEIVDLDDTDLIDWVHNHVAAVIARPLRGEHRWCPQWWEHPEALFRFTALHRAWTELAAEPGAALSIWIRDHLDPCLRELMAPNGPFTDCNPPHRHHAADIHNPLPTLPTAVPTDHPG